MSEGRVRLGPPSARLFLVRLRPRRAGLRFTGQVSLYGASRQPGNVVDTFRGSPRVPAAGTNARRRVRGRSRRPRHQRGGRRCSRRAGRGSDATLGPWSGHLGWMETSSATARSPGEMAVPGRAAWARLNRRESDRAGHNPAIHAQPVMDNLERPFQICLRNCTTHAFCRAPGRAVPPSSAAGTRPATPGRPAGRARRRRGPRSARARSPADRRTAAGPPGWCSGGPRSGSPRGGCQQPPGHPAVQRRDMRAPPQASPGQVAGSVSERE